MSHMTDTTTTAMGRALRDAREAQGWTLDEAAFQARIRFPHLRASRMKIHRYETGPVDRARLDVPMVMALALLYGLRISEIDPSLSDEARAIREVADLVSPCNPDEGPNGPPNLSLAA